ncbi:MAG TPA: MBL fold metallo-hydrolase [bacterium]|nr:MBL fold metallo-hydrolase [bacterium]
MNLINSEVKILQLVVGPVQTNCYIVFSDKKNAVIIDPGDEPEKILRTVEKQNLNVKYIINTHGHCDHIGANHIKNKLKPFPLLGIHQQDEPYIKDTLLNLSEIMGTKYIPVEPDIILNDNQRIVIDDSIWFDILHTPGHTPGSISLKLDNYLFSGDLIFFQSIGRTDLPGGDENLMQQSLKRICCLDKKLVIFPGHGPKTTLKQEIKTNPYLV